jgi:hypothetical protein
MGMAVALVRVAVVILVSTAVRVKAVIVGQASVAKMAALVANMVAVVVTILIAIAPNQGWQSDAICVVLVAWEMPVIGLLIMV